MQQRFCQILFYMCIVVLLYSCNDGKEQNRTAAAESAFPVKYSYNLLEGVYSGDFGGSNIHLSLRKVTGRNAVGYSVYKGVKRNFSGPMEVMESGFHFMLKEPGNSPYDGVFDIKLDTIAFVISGKWMPKSDKNLSIKTFILKKIIVNPEDRPLEDELIFTDSVTTLTFQNSGQCIYEFYTMENGVRSNQLKKVSGNWELHNNIYSIEWEKNTELQEQKSSIALDSMHYPGMEDGNYYLKCITFNGRKLPELHD